MILAGRGPPHQHPTPWFPLLLTKLWSVYPRLFAWPPAQAIFSMLERLCILALVGPAR